MMSRPNKRALFGLLYCVYFLLYATSPLSYSHAAEISLDNIDTWDKASLVSREIKLFFWELLCSEITLERAVPAPDTSFGVLLRKKRAVISDNGLSGPKLLKNAVSIVESGFSPASYPSSSLEESFNLSGPSQHLLCYRCGLSPPVL